MVGCSDLMHQVTSGQATAAPCPTSCQNPQIFLVFRVFNIDLALLKTQTIPTEMEIFSFLMTYQRFS